MSFVVWFFDCGTL